MQVTIDGKEVKLPDFLIVGAAKSGTTSLYYYLKQHPQIFMPINKEPWFFTFAGVNNIDATVSSSKKNIVTDFNKYLNLFKDATDSQVLGEASTVYLYLYTETIKNIKKYHPNWKELKIIIIIRNPVERVFSHYLNDISTGLLNLSFEELIEKWKLKQLSNFHNYIDYGFYYNQIKYYKDNFDQVKIYLFEDLISSPALLVQSLFGFVGVDTSFIPSTEVIYNTSVVFTNKFLVNLTRKSLFKVIARVFVPKNIREKIKNKISKNFTKRPQLKSFTRSILKEIYEEDVLKLQDLINRDLMHWLK